MNYRETLHRVATSGEATALTVHRRWRAGEFTDAEFDAFLATGIARANGRAAALADLALAAAITRSLKRPVAPLGLLPPASDTARLTAAAQTLRAALGDTPDPEARVARLGRAEPLTTAARTFSTGMDTSPHVNGWVRNVSSDACELCQSLAEDGHVFPASAEMATHTGCSCFPEPVTT